MGLLVKQWQASPVQSKASNRGHETPTTTPATAATSTPVSDEIDALLQQAEAQEPAQPRPSTTGYRPDNDPRR